MMRQTNSDQSATSRPLNQQQRVLDNVVFGWTDYWWVVLLFAAISTGALLTAGTSPDEVIAWIRFPHSSSAQAPADVLIVTANPERRLQVAATLSPRGMRPLLAETLAQVEAQVATHPRTLRMAVVDEAAVNSRKIGIALARSLPGNRIVLLPRSSSRTEIPQMLLDRL